MESLKMMFILAVCISGCLQLTAGVATSHQSIVSGEGWGYSYGIVHGPHGIGHAVGESYPHGYGGFGTYAPSYSYGGFAYDGTHEPHHGLPVPAIHAPLPPHAELHYAHPEPAVHLPELHYAHPEPALHLPELHYAEHAPILKIPELHLAKYPAPQPFHLPVKTEPGSVKTIYPLPHAVPTLHEAKPIASPEYVLPSYLAGNHYGGGYFGDYGYGDFLSNYYDEHDDQFLKDFYKSYGEGLHSDNSGLKSDYLSGRFKAYYKPNYNDYYGSTSYHH